MTKKIIDVGYTEINNSNHIEYYTIDEVSKILNIEDYNIIYWCNKLNDFLKIQSIGMYQIFNETDIKNLKLIKELNIDKKMSIPEIKIYINKHNEAIITKKKNNPLEISLLNIMSKIITMQNKKVDELINLQNRILQNNQEIMGNQIKFKEFFMQYHKEICLDREEQNIEIQQIKDTQEKNQEQIVNEIKKGINELKNTTQVTIKTLEQETTKRDTEMLNTLRQHMKERKEMQLQLEQEKKKSIWSRIFSK